MQHVFSFVFGMAAALWYARALQRAGVELDSQDTLKRARLAVACVFALILTIGAGAVVGMSPDVAWSLPVEVEVHLLRAVWMVARVVMLLVFGSVIILALRIRHRERAKLVVAALAVLAAMESAFWRATRPIHEELARELTRDGVVLQTSGVSCAAAS